MKAVIFDKDGILIETFNLHAKAHLKVLSKIGVKAKIEDVAKRYGKLTSQILKEIMQEYGREITDYTAQKMANEKEEIYREMAEKKLKVSTSTPSLSKITAFI